MAAVLDSWGREMGKEQKVFIFSEGSWCGEVWPFEKLTQHGGQAQGPVLGMACFPACSHTARPCKWLWFGRQMRQNSQGLGPYRWLWVWQNLRTRAML
eukprot:scaffold259457_cov17-Tisochrysis_lutea.AAC.1